MKKRIFLLFLVLLCCAGGGFLLLPGRLTQTEIAAYREEYPVYLNHWPPLIDGRDPESLQQVADQADTFVYGEILGEDEQTEHYSSHVFTYTQNRLKVIADSKGVFASGEEIMIFRSAEFDGYQPELTPGMKIIIPVSKSESREGYSYGFYGFYCVVEERYAISAFNETLAGDTNGLPVKRLLRTFR